MLWVTWKVRKLFSNICAYSAISELCLLGMMIQVDDMGEQWEDHDILDILNYVGN
jgi:hypothetical protein